MTAAIAPAMMGLSAAGTVMGALGKKEAGQAQSNADLFNASIARQNSAIAFQEGQAQQGIDTIQTERAIGATRAGFGAAGVDVGSGSPLAVMHDVAMTGELKKQLDAFRANVSSTSYTNQANLDVVNARQAREAGDIGEFATIFQGAGNLANASRAFPQPVSSM